MQAQMAIIGRPGRTLVVRPARRSTALTRCPLTVRASLGGVAEGAGSGTGRDSGRGPLLGPFLSVPEAAMGRGGSAFGDEGGSGSGSALGTMLARNRVNIILPSPPEKAPKLDDGGDGGGLGKNNHNGGGGGDGGGDDDDFFGGGEGDGEGDGSGGGGGGFFRLLVPELFDRAALAAVLQEWFKTIADLPLFIRRSAEMGLYSSAQLVRFLSMDVRPGVARAVSRGLPTDWAREFVGRLMADPAFAQKLAVEQALAFSASMLHEWRVRGDAFKSELDLALINSASLAAAAGAAVWVTAPSRAAGAVHAYPWQRMLSALPHCVFDASGPLRSYTPAARVGGFFASMAALSAAGAAAGAAAAGLSSLNVALRRRADPGYEPSVPVPSIGRSSAGLGAFFALNANARYQLLGGLDRYLFGHAAALWTYVMMTSAARVAGVAFGERTRASWQGFATETAASHLRPRTRVRRVRRRVAKKPAAAAAAAASAVQHLPAIGAGGGHDAALAALVAAGVAAEQQREMDHDRRHGGADGGGGGSERDGLEPSVRAVLYDPIDAAAAASLGGGGGGGSGSKGGWGGLEGDLEAQVEGRLGGAPAVMGSPEGLQALTRGAARPERQAGAAAPAAVA